MSCCNGTDCVPDKDPKFMLGDDVTISLRFHVPSSSDFEGIKDFDGAGGRIADRWLRKTTSAGGDYTHYCYLVDLLERVEVPGADFPKLRRVRRIFSESYLEAAE
jgi:hypothetical protein